MLKVGEIPGKKKPAVGEMYIQLRIQKRGGGNTFFQQRHGKWPKPLHRCWPKIHALQERAFKKYAFCREGFQVAVWLKRGAVFGTIGWLVAKASSVLCRVTITSFPHKLGGKLQNEAIGSRNLIDDKSTSFPVARVPSTGIIIQEGCWWKGNTLKSG